MLTTVCLDHQPRTMAGKVSEIMSDRHLASKAPFWKTLTKQVPKAKFGIGRISP